MTHRNSAALFEARGIAAEGGVPAHFILAAGECLPLMGPSGSGKSRLLRALADLDPHGGECLLEGRPQGAMAGSVWRRQVGYVPAESGWWGTRVAEHFRDPAWLAGRAPALGLAADCGDWTVARLSTGERQRLALLRALEREPAVLLLDEPSSGLDASAREAVEDLLAGWLGQGRHGALLVTHDAAQAQRLNPRRCLHIDRGALQEHPLLEPEFAQ